MDSINNSPHSGLLEHLLEDWGKLFSPEQVCISLEFRRSRQSAMIFSAELGSLLTTNRDNRQFGQG